MPSICTTIWAYIYVLIKPAFFLQRLKWHSKIHLLLLNCLESRLCENIHWKADPIFLTLQWKLKNYNDNFQIYQWFNESGNFMMNIISAWIALIFTHFFWQNDFEINDFLYQKMHLWINVCIKHIVFPFWQVSICILVNLIMF